MFRYRFLLVVGVLVSLSCVEKVESPSGPGRLLRPAGDTLLFVLNTLSEDLSLVDVTAESLLAHPYARAGLWANRMAWVPDGRLLVVNSGDNALQVIHLADGRVDTVWLGDGKNPYDVTVSTRYRRAYVTNWLDHTLSAVDLDRLTVVGEARVCFNPQGVEVVGDRVFVACVDFLHNYAGGGVMALDALTLDSLWFRRTGVNPQAVVADPEGDLYVLATGDYGSVEGVLYRLDFEGNLRDSVFLGGSPGSLSYADGVLVIAGFSGGVVLWDADREREIRRFSENNVADAVLVGGRLFLALFDRDRVVMVDTSTGAVLRTFPVGDGPVDLLVVP